MYKIKSTTQFCIAAAFIVVSLLLTMAPFMILTNERASIQGAEGHFISYLSGHRV